MVEQRRTSGLPLVAVVGRPNVGKSSLVNRVVGRREAIVEPTPGVTRDRTSFVAEWGGRRFEMVDTGGLEPGTQGIGQLVAEQAQVAIEAADLIVFVVDVQTGINEDDLRVADLLRRSTTPVIVAANKVDEAPEEAAVADFFRLGLGDPIPVSALHGRGSGDLLEELIERLPTEMRVTPDAWASMAIVGRPNVGKSSLLNMLLGEERAIVDPRPGTTRDPVDSFLHLDDTRTLKLVDTAGMRRRVQIKDPIEYFSFLRSRGTLERVDAAALMIDAGDGVTGHDQRIAEEIVKSGRACVVVLNKWDLVTTDETERKRFDHAIDDRLRFLPWATRLRTSALTGRGVDKLIPAIEVAVAAHRTRVPTAVVNRIVAESQERRPPPRSRSGRSTRVLYAVQASVGPPRFVLFSTGPLQDSYLRYIEKEIRAHEPFTGSPVIVRARVRTRR
ncbi:MAG: ribosome biogenesis GTPase Der [Actinomycetota bacterium]